MSVYISGIDCRKINFPKTRTDVSMRELMNKYKVFLFDRYGVVKTVNGDIPGALESVRKIQSAGKIIGVASNTGTTSPEQIQEKWQKYGLNIEDKWIITGGKALANYVKEHQLENAPAINLGNEATAQYIRNAGLTILFEELRSGKFFDAEIVVIGADPFKLKDAEIFDYAINALSSKNIPAILLVSDELIPRSFNESGLGAGSTAVLIEELTGKKVINLSKPAVCYFRIIHQTLKETNLLPADALIVGDDLYADILGACNAGFDNLLVDTGISGLIRKGVIKGKVARRQKLLEKIGVRPTYNLKSIVF
jgi:HAD superfamily hydrolase (TIGR01450 family)